jgi:cobalt/nickel transport system permease protein
MNSLKIRRLIMLKQRTEWLWSISISILFVGGLIFVYPPPAYAMHISEGILPFNWCVLWYVLAFIFVALGIRIIQTRIKRNMASLPLLGLMGAAIFLISCFPIPVPIAGTCSHPCGTPLAAIIVGVPFISTVLGAIALLIQALFLAHGGISTWGANIMSMAIAGSFVGFGVFILLRKLQVSVAVSAFAAGILGDWATYAVTGLELAISLHGNASFWDMWRATIIAFAPTQLPLGILEGFFTAGVVLFVQRRRPEMLSYLIPFTKESLPETVKEGG